MEADEAKETHARGSLAGFVCKSSFQLHELPFYLS